VRALRGTRCFIVTATIAGLLAFAAPATAAAPDAGLFGSSDPTYDGVYRQSLAILALEEAGATVPASAITWLKAQQCLDGRFMAYRASLRTACPAPDPEAFTGPDTNSTALAAMALEAVGEKAAAAKAVKSLVASQNPDGGWGYTFGSPSDANSTGLILAALDGTSDGEVASERKGLRYFRSIAGNCAKSSECGLIWNETMRFMARSRVADTREHASDALLFGARGGRELEQHLGESAVQRAMARSDPPPMALHRRGITARDRAGLRLRRSAARQIVRHGFQQGRVRAARHARSLHVGRGRREQCQRAVRHEARGEVVVGFVPPGKLAVLTAERLHEAPGMAAGER